jgi:hypothetical protein
LYVNIQTLRNHDSIRLKVKAVFELEPGELFLADVKRINEGNIVESGKVLCTSSRPRPRCCRSAVYGNVACPTLPRSRGYGEPFLPRRQNIALFEPGNL